MKCFLSLAAFALPYSAIAAGFGDPFPRSPTGASASPTSASSSPAKPMPPSAAPAATQKPTGAPVQAPPSEAKQKK